MKMSDKNHSFVVEPLEGNHALVRAIRYDGEIIADFPFGVLPELAIKTGLAWVEAMQAGLLESNREKRSTLCGIVERDYWMITSAVIRLHNGMPLFFALEGMEGYNEKYRKLLIRSLLAALDLMEQSGLVAEKTHQLEKIRRAYASM